jgi:uncharacterized delta-60 repeat protein
MEVDALIKRSMRFLCLSSVCLAFAGVLTLPAKSFAAWVPDTFDPIVTCAPEDEAVCVQAVAVQADGKVLIGGAFTMVDGVSHNRIARLDANGNLDATFNVSADAHVDRIALQPDGKIVIGGHFTELSSGATTTTRNYIARLNTDGSIDPVFNPNVDDNVSALAVQQNGKILVGGNFSLVNGNLLHPFFVRLNTDGTWDNTFTPNVSNTVQSIIVLEGPQQILIGGNFFKMGCTYCATLAGCFDTSIPPVELASYGGCMPGADLVNYVALINMSGGSQDTSLQSQIDVGQDQIYSIARQSDGKIVVGGGFNLGSGQNYIARLNSNGTIDSYNPNANGPVYALALQASDNLITAGTFTAIGGATRHNIARLTSSGTPDSTFDPNADGTINALYTYPSGTGVIAVGGFNTIGGTTRNHVARLHDATPAATSTSISSNPPNTSTYGSSVTFTATVIPSTATGTVNFMEGTTLLGSGTLSGGITTFSTTALTVGSHSIAAVYGGDANFATSTSSTLSQTVNQVPTTMSISAPAVTYNANGIVTVTVTSSVSSAVTGSVSLSVDGAAATTQTLSNGSASFTITSPSVVASPGHTLSASYAAQGNFGASSGTGNLTVNPMPTTMSISAPAIAYGANGTVTVTMTPAIPLVTGNVSLKVDGGIAMLQALSGGVATFVVTSPSYGNHTLDASYVAQGNFGAIQASGTLSVGGAVTTTIITSPSPVTYGANGSVTVTVSSGVGTPTGSVSLSVDGTPLPAQGLVSGSTTFTIIRPRAAASPGLALSASYTAQGNFGASSGTGTLTVNKAVLTVTANNASKVYNTANPVFTASYSGFVIGDTQAVLSGVPSLTTTATTASSVGTYPITAAAGSLSAANYSFSFGNGTLIIMPDGNFDVTIALRIAAGIDPQQAPDLVHADVAPLLNGMPQPDGKIDIDDVVMILRKADGLSSW